jgi:hypothetical protein
MADLSHSARLEVERSKAGIDTLRKTITDLGSFQTRMHLEFFTTGNFVALGRRSLELEQSLTNTVRKLFSESTPERAQMLEGVKTGAWGSQLTDKDAVKSKFESNIAKAKDALELGIRVFEARIGELEGRSAAPATTAQTPTKRAEKDLINFKVRIPFTGVEIDVKEAWRRLKG